MKVFLTGGTGFIGGAVARALQQRGDQVTALVRTPAKAAELERAGVTLVQGDLGDVAAIERGMQDADAVIHGAAVYEVGIPASQRAAMEATNVQGTENVLGAALKLKIPRVLYISTVGVFGNTHGKVLDESGPLGSGEGSWYERTKIAAHRTAQRLREQGLPLIIVQPGGVYGPGDHSQLGNLMHQFVAGKLPAMAFPGLGINFVHRDDVVAGILLTLDRGRVGESYILGGEMATAQGFVEVLSRVTGRRPPRLTVPTMLLRLSAPLGPLVAPRLGFPPNLSELISASDNVTYWARHDKAMRELGYAPRPLEQGLRDTLQAEGLLPAAA
ncbi:MAG TPA: NAD-dependent epimerase/dehydratase family protein [Candidatus Dormibacteraeota bacterium]|jgi:nucleoside-diphosphate-sugar epimerase|nr:NAD-dependent epimerase/dehydratase family protein [Candidatus Dormibacteraeota bacterium]